MEEEDPKLKEFLEVMQPASKSKKWASGTTEDPSNEPPKKIQAIELPEAESDEEYEAVPKKPRHKSPPKSNIHPADIPATQLEAAVANEEIMTLTAPDVTDDDWLRGRTNRLLDLMDPEDISNATNVATSGIDVEEAIVEPTRSEEAAVDKEGNKEEDFEKSDPVIEAIQSNGRLFVRNLPYTATEDDLRKHFEPYGALEEVGPSFPFRLPRTFMMNIQIGTAYA